MNKPATPTSEPGPQSLHNVLEGLIEERGYRRLDQAHAGAPDGQSVPIADENVVRAADVPAGYIGNVYAQKLWGLAIKAERSGDSEFAQYLTLSATTCGTRGNGAAFGRHFGLDKEPSAGDTIDLAQSVHAKSLAAFVQILIDKGQTENANVVKEANAACIARVLDHIRQGIAMRDTRAKTTSVTS